MLLRRRRMVASHLLHLVLSIPVTVYGVADTQTITLKDHDSNQSGVQSYNH